MAVIQPFENLVFTTNQHASLTLDEVLSTHRSLVLYFYPKDMTSGCSKQADDFKAHYGDFRTLGVEVMGVSRDSLASHQRFIDQHSLPFALVSDPEQTLCDQFAVMREKSMYGRRYWGIDRSTFIIGAQRQIIAEWRSVKVPGHVATVLSHLNHASE